MDLDRIDTVKEIHSDPVSSLRREMDSLDDFEHLGHDVSPLKEAASDSAASRDPRPIDTGVKSIAANQVDLSSFDPLKKMDSNLLEMGDNPVKTDKLDHFLQDLDAPLKHEEPPEVPDKDGVKSATQAFVDFEREPLVEKYSDSEPEEDFKPSKVELPETFKDVEEERPELPQKDYSEPEKEPEPPKPEPAKPPKGEMKQAEAVGAEAIFCKMGLMESLIYWRDPKKSGPVFGSVLIVLLALTYFSLISVVAYLSLLALTGTISFRIYKNIVQAVQKTGDGHPFREILELDISLPQEKVKEVSEIAVAHINAAVAELRRLFLVEDLVDSIKFGVLLWTLTYLGAWFNGMTLIIIAWVALFTLPKVYEANKTQIDANLAVVRTKLEEITSKVKAAIPIGKKTEEKKEQ